MESILINDRLDPGQFGDLMDQRRGVVAEQSMTTATTGVRLAVERLADLLGWDQVRAGLAMPGLPAAFLPGGRGGGLALHPDRVGRGGLGRVGGVELEPGFEVIDSGFQRSDLLTMNLDQRQDRRLEFGRGVVPEMIRERRRGCHSNKIVP